MVITSIAGHILVIGGGGCREPRMHALMNVFEHALLFEKKCGEFHSMHCCGEPFSVLLGQETRI